MTAAGVTPRAMAVRVLLVFALGYFVSYLFRSINIGFAPFLRSEMGMSAADLGTLTGIYYLAFALVQIPAGILLDTYGPRRVNAAMMLLAAVGTVIFGLAQDYAGLMLGRILIGIGVAACLNAAFKALAGVFPLRRLPFVNGLVMAIGGLGGVVVGTPLNWLLQFSDWRVISISIAGVTVLVAAAIWLGGRGPAPLATHRPHLLEQVRGTRDILVSARFWQAASLAVMTSGVFYAVQSLWLAPFLMEARGMSVDRTAALVSILGLAMVTGNVLLGAAARMVERFGLTLFQFAGGCMVIFLLVQLVVLLGWPVPAVLLWVAYGLFGSASILSYAVMAERFPHSMLGRVGTSLTLMTFLLIFLCQVGVGWILSFWQPMADGNYPPQAHLVAWGTLLALQVLAAIWYFWPMATPLPASAEAAAAAEAAARDTTVPDTPSLAQPSAAPGSSGSPSHPT